VRDLLQSSLAIGLVLLAQFASAESVPHVNWIRQFGTAGNDIANRVSADGLGNVYVAGSVDGPLDGPYSGGGGDVFLARYDAQGDCLWTRQSGTSAYDGAWALSADGLGNVFFGGWGYGSFAGTNPNSYSTDAFVGNYDAGGTRQWCYPISTTSGDLTFGISADGQGNAFISGHTGGSLAGTNAGSWDPYLSRYNAAGTRQWIRQIGTVADDQCRDVGADGQGSVYITGFTYGPLFAPQSGGTDVFLKRYDAAGNPAWGWQFGTASDDRGLGVSADGLGDVFIAGDTLGTLGESSAGDWDAFVAMCDAEGNLVWKRQFGTPTADHVWRVVADGQGNVYLAGSTSGALAGPPPEPGYTDGFVAKYDAAGNQIWILQLALRSYDNDGWGLSTDAQGNVYLSGGTYGSLDGRNAGGMDAFVVSISEAPEPGTLLLCLTAVSTLAAWSLARRGRYQAGRHAGGR
jgi:hypothetical protein